MNTKIIPAILSLLAGIVALIVTYIRKATLIEILTTLFIVLLSFYIFGCIIKAIMDKYVAEKEETEEEGEGEEGEGEEGEEDMENIETREEQDAQDTN